MSQLHDSILATLKERTTWEARQAVWYQMGHDGVPRSHPPYPGAANLHWPLVDGMISKFLPFYVNVIFQQELLAEFNALDPMLKDQCASAADYFNWELRENSRFETEFMTTLYTMLLRGRGIQKIKWNPFKDCLEFIDVDPLMFIMPATADRIDEADYFVHATQMSVAQYLRDPRFTAKSDSIIQQIRGGESYKPQMQEQAKYMREGLTYSSDKNEIIVWEAYEKTRGGHTVRTYSPLRPELALRAPHGTPYKMNGESFAPFWTCQMEVKDKGWYSPRGLAEKLAPYETAMTRMLNIKFDWYNYISRPVFTNDDEVPGNNLNIQLAPGSSLPKGMKPAILPQLPREFEAELQQQKLIAEQYIQAPDSNLVPDKTMGNGGSQPTATQINYQASLASGGVDLKGRILRIELGEEFRMAWAILVHHKKKEAAYFTAGDRKILPAEALREDYMIAPSGSAESWDKGKRIQRAIARKQLFQNDPGIDQEGLNKGVLAADDPRLIKQLIIPQNQRDSSEQEAEGVDLLLLQDGFPASVQPNENHALRIETILHWFEAVRGGKPTNQIAVQRVLAHLAQHLALLLEQNPAVGKQAVMAVQQQIPEFAQAVAQLMQQFQQGGTQPQGPQPANVQPMPAPGPVAGGPQPIAEGGPA